MSYLRKKTLSKNYKYLLEEKYINNLTIINDIWDDIDLSEEESKINILLYELDIYEKENNYIKIILNTIMDY